MAEAVEISPERAREISTIRWAKFIVVLTLLVIAVLYAISPDPEKQADKTLAEMDQGAARATPPGIRIVEGGSNRERMSAVDRALRASGEPCDGVVSVADWGYNETGRLWKATCKASGMALVETRKDMAVRVVSCSIAYKIGANCLGAPALPPDG